MSGPRKNRCLDRPRQLRRFVCPDCGYVRDAAKWKGKTGVGHIKDLWCPACREMKKFVQTE